MRQVNNVVGIIAVQRKEKDNAVGGHKCRCRSHDYIVRELLFSLYFFFFFFFFEYIAES